MSYLNGLQLKLTVNTPILLSSSSISSEELKKSISEKSFIVAVL